MRQLPATDPEIVISGKGAFTWVTCWACSAESFSTRVRQVMKEYGLFVVEEEQIMPFSEAEPKGIVTDELLDQHERTSSSQDFVIFGTFHNYTTDQ